MWVVAIVRIVCDGGAKHFAKVRKKNELCKKKDYYLILTKKNALFAANNIN